jgi:hypothetical protein
MPAVTNCQPVQQQRLAADTQSITCHHSCSAGAVRAMSQVFVHTCSTSRSTEAMNTSSDFGFLNLSLSWLFSLIDYIILM